MISTRFKHHSFNDIMSRQYVDKGIKLFGHGPTLHRIRGNKFQIFELKEIDFWEEERIDDIFDGRIDLELMLSQYNTKSLIIAYNYVDIFDDFKEHCHTVAVKYSYRQ